MHVRLKQFSVGKFMLHRCDSWGIENCCMYLNFCGPIFAGKWLKLFFDDEFWATDVISGSAGNFTYSYSNVLPHIWREINNGESDNRDPLHQQGCDWMGWVILGPCVSFVLSRTHDSRYRYFICTISVGDRGGTVVKALCYKSEGRWFNPRWCHWKFSLT